MDTIIVAMQVLTVVIVILSRWESLSWLQDIHGHLFDHEKEQKDQSLRESFWEGYNDEESKQQKDRKKRNNAK